MTKPKDVVPIFLAELIGTGMLLFMGCAGCLGWAGAPPHLQMALNFGLVIMIIIQIFGAVSGAHTNPAITVTALICKKVTAPMALIYVSAQVVGAFMGFGLLKVLTPAHVFVQEECAVGHCMTMPHFDVTLVQAMVIEFIATSVLVMFQCALWDRRNSHTHDSLSLRFGLAVSSLAFTVGPYTGCSMNPARSLAPALWHGDLRLQWVYWVAPLAAAVITSPIYRIVFAVHAASDREKSEQTETLNGLTKVSET